MEQIIVADGSSITVDDKAAEGATRAAIARLAWEEYAKAVRRDAPEEERKRLFDMAVEAEDAADPFGGRPLDENGNWICESCDQAISAEYLDCPNCITVEPSTEPDEGWRCRCLQRNPWKRVTCSRCDVARRICEVPDY